MWTTANCTYIYTCHSDKFVSCETELLARRITCINPALTHFFNILYFLISVKNEGMGSPIYPSNKTLQPRYCYSFVNLSSTNSAHCTRGLSQSCQKVARILCTLVKLWISHNQIACPALSICKH